MEQSTKSSMENSEGSTDTSLSVLNTEKIKEEFGYNGTFTEETFTTLKNNIVISGKKITFDCNADDFDEDLTLDDKAGAIKYKNDLIAIVRFNDGYERKSDDEKVTMMAIVPTYSCKDVYVGGIGFFSDNTETLKEYFGEPIVQKETEYSQSKYTSAYIYQCGDYYVIFMLTTDNYIRAVLISDKKWLNTDF